MTLTQPIFYTAGESPALVYARNCLTSWGYDISPIPTDHVTHLLLPVPSFASPGILKGGRPLHDILKNLGAQVAIIGGYLPPLPYQTADLLKDEYYLTENAAITAHCALKRLLQSYPGTLQRKQVLVIGWGRIGKHLASLLRSRGADVTVAARKEADQYALRRQQYCTTDLKSWDLMQYTIIINTAPTPLMHQDEASEDAILMDLASTRGILGDRVDHALALPGKDAPEESGELIAKTALRYALGKE